MVRKPVKAEADSMDWGLYLRLLTLAVSIGASESLQSFVFLQLSSAPTRHKGDIVRTLSFGRQPAHLASQRRAAQHPCEAQTPFRGSSRRDQRRPLISSWIAVGCGAPAARLPSSGQSY